MQSSFVTFIVSSLFAFTAWAVEGDVPAGDSNPYQPTWNSLKAHKDPEWFRDAKFGIYTAISFSGRSVSPIAESTN